MGTATQRFDTITSILREEDRDMGRRRLQQKGDLYKQGGMWKLRWMEDQIDRHGIKSRGWSRPVSIGPCMGPKRFTKIEARRIAWETHLSRLDQNNLTPQSIMTVRDFVESRFIPEHVTMLKPGGRLHYGTMLAFVLDGTPEKKTTVGKWAKDEDGKGIAPSPPRRIFGLGDMRLRDVNAEHCQRLISAALSAGYSVQYAAHIRNAISAVFSHAESKDWFTGRNPAKRVNLPENVPAPQSSLSFEQLRQVLAALDPMTRAMFAAASLTSMNIAELSGLKWKYVNLAESWRNIEGEALPPKTLAVRWQWAYGQLGTVKAAKRRRLIPVADLLSGYLNALRVRITFTDPDDFVFTTTGTPIDSKNLLRRRLKPIGKAIGVKLGWHTARRTFDTLADQIGMSLGERQAIMGHSDAAMTMRYTRTPSEQARGAIEQMAKLVGETPN